MPPASQIQVPPALRDGYLHSEDTDEVAAMAALGVEMMPGCEAKKIFTAQNPYESGRPQLEFTLNSRSSTWGTPTGELLDAYRRRDGAAAAALDDLVDQVSDEGLRESIRQALPKALACYGGAFSDRLRHDVLPTLHEALEVIKGRNRKGQRYVVARNSSREFLRKLKIE